MCRGACLQKMSVAARERMGGGKNSGGKKGVIYSSVGKQVGPESNRGAELERSTQDGGMEEGEPAGWWDVEKTVWEKPRVSSLEGCGVASTISRLRNFWSWNKCGAKRLHSLLEGSLWVLGSSLCTSSWTSSLTSGEG